jgi:PIN domain
MKVVIDTTVLGRDSTLAGSDAQLLKVFLTRTQSELCVPRLVFEESVNLVRKSVSDFNRAAKDAGRLSKARKTFAPVDVEMEVKEYRNRLDSAVKACNARILDLPKVGHEELLGRVLAAVKPFTDKGRGYKDALIWFTIVELLQSCDEDLVFISDNHRDWARGQERNLLHLDFWKDLSFRKIKPNRVVLIASLSEFNQEYTLKTLKELSPTDAQLYPDPDYQQILTDGHDFVKTEMPAALAGLLGAIARFEAEPLEVTLLALSLPSDIQKHEQKVIEGGRRVLQFAASYTATIEFPVLSPNVPAHWNQFSYRVIADVTTGSYRVNATVRIRANFHMIVDGENTESFSFALQTDTDMLGSVKVS